MEYVPKPRTPKSTSGNVFHFNVENIHESRDVLKEIEESSKENMALDVGNPMSVQLAGADVLPVLDAGY